MDWEVEALKHLGGKAGVVQVSKQVWKTHAADLAASDDLFYTWQYDIRWAAQKLRNDGVLKAMHGRKGPGEWELA